MIPDVNAELGNVASQKQTDFRAEVDQQNPNVAVYQDNEDLGFAEKIADELISVSGAWVTVYLRSDHEGFDKVWNEDVDPTYHNGVRLKGYFKPEPLQEELTKFGVDTPNKTTIVFSRFHLLRAFGERSLRAGDLIELPYGPKSDGIPQKYRILNVSLTGNFRYLWLYQSCDAEAITGDITIVNTAE